MLIYYISYAVYMQIQQSTRHQLCIAMCQRHNIALWQHETREAANTQIEVCVRLAGLCVICILK